MSQPSIPPEKPQQHSYVFPSSGSAFNLPGAAVSISNANPVTRLPQPTEPAPTITLGGPEVLPQTHELANRAQAIRLPPPFRDQRSSVPPVPETSEAPEILSNHASIKRLPPTHTFFKVPDPSSQREGLTPRQDQTYPVPLHPPTHGSPGDIIQGAKPVALLPPLRPISRVPSLRRVDDEMEGVEMTNPSPSAKLPPARPENMLGGGGSTKRQHKDNKNGKGKEKERASNARECGMEKQTASERAKRRLQAAPQPRRSPDPDSEDEYNADPEENDQHDDDNDDDDNDDDDMDVDGKYDLDVPLDRDALWKAIVDDPSRGEACIAALEKISAGVMSKAVHQRRRKADLQSKADKLEYAKAVMKQPQLMYGTRGGVGAKDRFGGDRVLDNVVAPKEFKNPRKESVNTRNASLRVALLVLLGVDHKKDINFNIESRGDLPSRQDFFINWWEPLDSRPNEEAICILVAFLQEKKAVDWGGVKVASLRRSIKKHLKYRIWSYLKTRDVVAAARKGLRESAISRCYGVLHRRLAVLVHYIAEDGIEALYRLIVGMGVRATSSDEEDEASSERLQRRVYVIHEVHYDYHLSKELKAEKEALDTIYQERLRGKLKNGAIAHERVQPEERIDSRRAPKFIFGLPINAYSENWLQSLSPTRRRDLEATKAVDLTAARRLLASLRKGEIEDGSDHEGDNHDSDEMEE